MIKKVKAWCDRHQLLRQGDRILIACSGGPDSLALTDILLCLQPAYDLQLAAAHVDHMFRGEASRADADFAEAFCKEKGLLFFKHRFDVPTYAREKGLSPEDAARGVRYDFLRSVAASLGGAKIVTGHHRDDQAETVLLHLLRGAGSGGIAGIRPENGDIIRPFLSVTKAEIELYCSERGLQPRMDETNLEDCYLRNKIRLHLLPELVRAYNPAIRDSLCRSAELVGAEHDFIREQAERYRKEHIAQRESTLIFQRASLHRLHLAVKREVFRLAIEELQGHLKEIAFFHIEEMIRFAESGRSGTTIELPNGLRLERAYEALWLFQGTAHAVQGNAAAPLALQIPGRTVAENFTVAVEAEILQAYRQPQSKWEIVCDLDRLVLPLYLRRRQPGDRFQPSGMQGSKKLKDFLIDCKVQRETRDRMVLVCDGNGIIWLGGHRQNQPSRATLQTKRFLFLTMKKDGEAEGESYV